MRSEESGHKSQNHLKDARLASIEYSLIFEKFKSKIESSTLKTHCCGALGAVPPKSHLIKIIYNRLKSVLYPNT